MSQTNPPVETGPQASPASPAEPPPTTPAEATWSLCERLGFRYLTVYWLLYSLPQVPQSWLSLVSQLFATVPKSWREAIGVDLESRPWRWPGKWSNELGDVGEWWQAATSWMWEQGLAPYEVIHQPTGSGDTGHDFARAIAIAVAAFALTASWSLFDRSRAYPRLGRWLHAVVRFELAFVLLGYGWAKVLDTQFGELGPMRLLQTVGDTSPMGLVGTMMKANPGYETFGGLGEVIGAVLLFHRRTTLLGACVTIAVMTNVAALNWLCGVPVKLFSAHLLVTAILLTVPFRARLWDVFVASTGSSRPVDLRLPHTGRTGRAVAIAGWTWAVLGLVLGVLGYFDPERRWQPPPKSELYGVWSVDTMRLDGQDLAKADAARWQFLAIDRGKYGFVRDPFGKDQWLELEFDAATSELKVRRLGAAPDPEPAVWKIERGTRTVRVDVPLVLRPADRNQKVDAERRMLRVEGTWQGKPLQLELVEKRFRLQADFRLRQELPEGW